jgi:polyisoprenoid-binding protein YceI
MVWRVAPILLVAALSAAAPGVAADNACVIGGRGFFRVYVDSGGLFAAFAHDHIIEAGKIDGCASVDAQNPVKSSVKLTFSTAAIHVMDPKDSAEDRAKVQKTMETEVLRITEFPTISFESTGVAADTGGRYRVSGMLIIRGKSSPVTIPVTVTRMDDGTYRVTGTYKLKQTTFGIEPIRLIGGTVRVKDEIRTEWELYLK